MFSLKLTSFCFYHSDVFTAITSVSDHSESFMNHPNSFLMKTNKKGFSVAGVVQRETVGFHLTGVLLRVMGLNTTSTILSVRDVTFTLFYCKWHFTTPPFSWHQDSICVLFSFSYNRKLSQQKHFIELPVEQTWPYWDTAHQRATQVITCWPVSHSAAIWTMYLQCYDRIFVSGKGNALDTLNNWAFSGTTFTLEQSCVYVFGGALSP